MYCKITAHLQDPDDDLIVAMINNSTIEALDLIRDGYRITLERDSEDDMLYVLHICEVTSGWLDDDDTEYAIEYTRTAMSTWVGHFLENPDNQYKFWR